VTVYVYAELAGLWIEAGGPGADAATAAAIAEAESGGDSTKIDNTAYPNLPGYHPPGKHATPEYSIGLWQINLLAHPQYTVSQMLDPLENARAAVAISKDGTDFGPWTTYIHGTYHKYLQANFTPQSPGATGGGVTSSGGLSDALAASVTATGAHGGWADLRNTTNRHLPTQLARSQALRLAALRALAGRTKVGS
jgi:Lysozyme like domain